METAPHVYQSGRRENRDRIEAAGQIAAPARARGEQVVQVFSLLGVSSTDGLARLTRWHAAAFRVSTSFTPDPVATEVLLRLAHDQADLVPTLAYSESRLREALPYLRALTVREPAEAAAAAREELAAQDLGGFPGQGEYEYFITVPASELPAVRAALGASPAADVVELMVARGEQIGATGELNWFTENGIDCRVQTFC